MNKMMPEVKTILLPSDPSQYADLIMRSTDFEKLMITSEDRVKGEQYNQNRKRTEYKDRTEDLTDFLYGLETQIVIRASTPDEIPRVHQLFTKTNQFNVTTLRYSLTEIEDFTKKEVFDLKIIEAKDRFGDLGIIGLYLIEVSDEEACIDIDSFILSCRVMGRGIEAAMMNQIKKDFLMDKSFLKMRATYIPTAKNKPSESFFETQGFQCVEVLEGRRKYLLEAGQESIVNCDWISIIAYKES